MDVSLSELREMMMDREAWHATIHGVAKSRTQLSNWTELKEKGNPSLPFWVKWQRTNSTPHSNQNIKKNIYWYFWNCYGDTHLSENLMNTLHDTLLPQICIFTSFRSPTPAAMDSWSLSLSWSWEPLPQGEHAPIQTDKHANVIIKDKVNGQIREMVLFRLWYRREILLVRYAPKERKSSLESCMVSHTSWPNLN